MIIDILKNRRKLTRTSGEVGSVTGNLTLSSVIGGNFNSEIFVFGNRINFTDSSATLLGDDDLVLENSFPASIPSPASRVGDGIRCLTTKNLKNQSININQ